MNIPLRFVRINVTLCTLSALLSLSFVSVAQTPLLVYDPVSVPGLTAPIDIANPYDGSDDLYIAERAGVIKIYSGGTIAAIPFLDLSGTGLISTEGEGGLLSVAFAPNYASSGYFFIYYTNAANDIEVARYKRVSPGVADAGSGKIVITIAHPQYTNHYGGKLNFGSDGYLYFATGDGGGSNDPFDNAMNGASLLGKMLRLNVNTANDTEPWYTIPPDNPYVTDSLFNPAIFSIGLRNPFRWSFDRMGQGPWDIWIGDVGQGRWEEVNLSPGTVRKTNYGWHCYEGRHINTEAVCTATDTLNPLFEYDHSAENGGISITGGMVYRGSDFPALYGWYVFIDYGTGNGWVLRPNEGDAPTVNLQRDLPRHIVAFAENSQREIFAVSLDGPLYRVSVSGVLPVKLREFNVLEETTTRHRISWKTASESNLKTFNLQISTNGSDFKTIASVAAANNPRGHSYSVDYSAVAAEAVYYRLQMVDADGKLAYSEVIQLKSLAALDVVIAPSLIREGRTNIRLSRSFNLLQVVDMTGQVVHSRKLNQVPGSFSLDLSALPKGTYLVRLTGPNAKADRRIVIQ